MSIFLIETKFIKSRFHQNRGLQSNESHCLHTKENKKMEYLNKKGFLPQLHHQILKLLRTIYNHVRLAAYLALF